MAEVCLLLNFCLVASFSSPLPLLHSLSHFPPFLPFLTILLFHLSWSCFSAGTVRNDYSSCIAEPQPLCSSCLLYPQYDGVHLCLSERVWCLCASASLSDWYEGSASRLLVWNEWWINDCIIQSEPGQYAQTEYLKASKLIFHCRAISKGTRRREEHCCTYWTYLRKTLLWMYFTHLLSCYSLQRFICLQAYVFVYVCGHNQKELDPTSLLSLTLKRFD